MCMLNHISHVVLFATLWSIACQAPVSMEFSRQEYLGGLLCPPPGDPPDPAYCLSSIPHLLCLLHWQVCSLPLASLGSLLHVLNPVQLFVIPWTAACQAPLSMEFPRQEHWSGFLCPTPGDLPHPGIESFISSISRQIPYHLSHLGSPK